jgi:hypothetical protein
MLQTIFLQDRKINYNVIYDIIIIYIFTKKIKCYIIFIFNFIFSNSLFKAQNFNLLLKDIFSIIIIIIMHIKSN